MSDAEEIARAFHEEYEAAAPAHGWETQERSRKAWEDVPAENKALMIHVVQSLLKKGVIRPSRFEVFTAPDGYPGIRMRPD